MTVLESPPYLCFLDTHVIHEHLRTKSDLRILCMGWLITETVLMNSIKWDALHFALLGYYIQIWSSELTADFALKNT